LIFISIFLFVIPNITITKDIVKDVVLVKVEDMVEVEDMRETITKKTDYMYECGIRITKENQIIKDKIFYDIPIGIMIWCSNTLIENCDFINCSDEGIVIFTTNNNTIKNCTFYSCCDGVELQQSSNNIFIDCNFLDCYHAGIDGIKKSNDNNQFINCTFTDNNMGVYFSQSENNMFVDCLFINNKVDRLY
jgi:parallel beta-helix repeat protein